MQKIKNHIPSILYCFMLMLIAVLCILVSEVFPTNALSASEPVVNDAPENRTSLTVPDTQQKPSPVPQSSIEIKKYEHSVPRESQTDNEYLYKQRIYGNGTTQIKSVIRTSVGVYIPVETDSTQGDVCGEKPCVGVVHLDAYGNVLHAISLESAYATQYVSAAPTPKGFVIVTESERGNAYYVHTLTYDLSVSSSVRINSALRGTLLPTQSDFLFFAEYANETLVYSFANDTITFQSVGAGRFIDIFEFGTYYYLYTTNDEEKSFTATKLSKQTLSVLSENTHTDSVLIGVFPISFDRKQCFVTLEEKSGALWAFRYENVALTSIQDQKKLGAFGIVKAFSTESTVLLVCDGNVTGFVTMNVDLSTTQSNGSLPFRPDTVYDSFYSQNVVYSLVKTDTGELAFVYTEKDVSFCEYLSIRTENAFLLQNVDGTFSVLYQDVDDIRMIVLDA